jgi:Gas vesicle protein
VTLATDRAVDGDVALVDLLDRLLAGGVVITGEITISLADVELVHVSLRALISSVDTLVRRP